MLLSLRADILLLFITIIISICSCERVKIAAFNIQVFGLTKMKNTDVIDNLIKIISQYDLVAVQEIRDSSEKAFPELIEKINQKNKSKYESIVGPRLGRTNSKEQYGIIYNPTKLKIIDSFTFEDSNDLFEREPLIVNIEVKENKENFLLIVLHAKPGSDVTYLEIDGLVDVYESAKKKFKNENAWIVGDLNADCDYMPKSKWSSVRLYTDSKFHWYISNDDDTTSGHNNCAYDRIIGVGKKAIESYVDDSAEVFDFKETYSLSDELTSQISDHFPVSFELSFTANKDNNNNDSNNDSNDDNKSISFVTGGIIAAASAVGVLVPCILMSYRRQRRRSDMLDMYKAIPEPDVVTSNVTTATTTRVVVEA